MVKPDRKIGDTVEIPIGRRDANFDRACDSAQHYARLHFGIDEDGHAERVEGWDRTRCWVEVRFVKLVLSGSDCEYWFVATVMKTEED